MPAFADIELAAPVHRVTAEYGAFAVLERGDGSHEGCPIRPHHLAVEAEQRCDAPSAAASAAQASAVAALLLVSNLVSTTSGLPPAAVLTHATAVLPAAGLPAAVVAAAARLQAAAALLRPAALPTSERFQGPIGPGAVNPTSALTSL